MHRRPIDPQFNEAIRQGRKITTIRRTPWPVGVPIQLYNWSGKPYASKQVPVAVVVSCGHDPVSIGHDAKGRMVFGVWGEKNKAVDAAKLAGWEGFESVDALETWFRRVVPKGQIRTQILNRFTLLSAAS